MCMSSVKNYQALYGLRFLVGFFEYVNFNFKFELKLTSNFIGPVFTLEFTIFLDLGTHLRKLERDP